MLSCLPAHLRLPAAWRHPVVRPDSDRQLLAHPPVSAEPAGAVSGCRYGPMREPRACSDRTVAPPLSRRGLRSRHPGKGRRDVRRNAVSRTRSPSLRRVPAHCLPGATHPYESLSPGLIQPQPAALTVQGK
ncbi:hypothetical protein K7G95_01145 (plasmid) [Escherichia coli]|nr:hypothetical protein K7G95_01145 [Escherichia coli]